MKNKNRVKDKEIKKNTPYSKKVSAIALSTFSVLSCVLAVFGVIFLKSNFSDTDAFKAFVDENYLLSILILILSCAVQVIIALIPGELVEIASGYAFGSVLGALICLIGITIGSIFVLFLSKRFGRRFVEAFYPREKIDSLPILNDPKKRNFFTFLLFLIPGTPKDLVTYIIGITDMSIPLYLILATFARLPSIIISTIGGHALGNSKFIFALIAFAISAFVSFTGYVIYSKITKKHQNNPKKSNFSNAHNNEK